MPVHLTVERIATLPVPSESERQRDNRDDVLRGFGVRVSYGGERASVVHYRGRRCPRRDAHDRVVDAEAGRNSEAPTVAKSRRPDSRNRRCGRAVADALARVLTGSKK